MGNISMGFHFGSLLVLIVLIVWVLRLQVMLKVWRDWGSANSDRRIIVGEPLRVLRQFAAALDVEFVSDVPMDSIPPARIKLESCFELHRRGGIEAIEIERGEKPCVNFILRHEPSTMEVTTEKLMNELGGAVAVQFRKSP
jgi:hypothetical protein